MVLYPIKSM